MHFTKGPWLAAMTLLMALSGCSEDDGFYPVPPTPAAPVADAGMDAAIHCLGEPAVCDAFDLSFATDCEAQTGCIADRRCRAGFAFSCFSLASEQACSQVGCTWTTECQGSGTCFTETNQTDCQAHAGCSWDSYCDPLSNPSDAYCAQFADDTSCRAVEACEWGYLTCSGTPAACASQNEEAACAAHRGCTWQQP